MSSSQRYALPSLIMAQVAASMIGATAAASDDVPLDNPDWLITDPYATDRWKASWDAKTMTLNNNLVSKQFVTAPGFGSVAYTSMVNSRSQGEVQMLRDLSPEARFTLNGEQYQLGNLAFNSDRSASGYAGYGGYWGQGVANSSEPFTASPANPSFAYQGVDALPVEQPLNWTAGLRGSPKDLKWPPPGVHVRFHFNSSSFSGLDVYVHYELYDGHPILAKWVTIDATNYPAGKKVTITDVVVEELRVHREFAPPTVIPAGTRGYGQTTWKGPWMDIANAMTSGPLIIQPSTSYGYDLDWSSEQTGQPFGPSGGRPGFAAPLLTVKQSAAMISSKEPGTFSLNLPHKTGLKVYDSFKAYTILTDSNDAERINLARARMWYLTAPWVTENPLGFYGCVDTDGQSAFQAMLDNIDAVGFEFYMFTFGCAWQLESTPVSFSKAALTYAQSKGIELGGYDLIDLDRGGALGGSSTATGPGSGYPHNKCFASAWVDYISEHFDKLVGESGIGFTGIITDGPYGGQSCSSTGHKYHENEGDSVFMQNKIQSDFYRKFRSQDVYIHQPDFFFHAGGSKIGMGYSEQQFSLERWSDIIVSRQTMFDATQYHTPTQGWMFFPIIHYHAGGSAAAFNPLQQNIVAYEFNLAQYFLYGVQPIFRGNHMWDTDEVKSMVQKWVGVYKTYRRILIAPIVHIKRPDQHSIDAIMHVLPYDSNTTNPVKGLVAAFNSVSQDSSTTLRFSIHYTGITTDSVTVFEQGDASKAMTLKVDRLSNIRLPVSLKGYTLTWFTVCAGGTAACYMPAVSWQGKATNNFAPAQHM